uniref:ATP synthase subunit a n=1 Tax=Atractomorpha echinata TaxID=52677 RepID=A0A076YJY9_9CHLO|nr:ATP synthase F0 subunit 6 [Atractomorpha echinata]
MYIFESFYSSGEGWQYVPLFSLIWPAYGLSGWISTWGLAVRLVLLFGAISHQLHQEKAQARGSALHNLYLAILNFWNNQTLERIHLRWRETPLHSGKTSHTLHSNRLTGSMVYHSIRARKVTGVWLIVLFIVILFSNCMGLAPGFEAVTGKAGSTLCLSFALWGGVTYAGVQRQGRKTVRWFLPSGPSWPMAPVFVLLELVSYCFRARSRGVRLWANMLAGHQLLHLVCARARVPARCTGIIGIPVTIRSAGLLMARSGLELIVCILQSGVFCLLASFYLHEARSKKYNCRP